MTTGVIAFETIKDSPLPEFFDGANIIAFVKGYPSPLILQWLDKTKVWVAKTSTKEVTTISARNIISWGMLPEKKWLKYIKPTPPKEKTAEELAADKEAKTSIEQFIAKFNKDWIGFHKNKEKEQKALERALTKEIKALGKHELIEKFKDFCLSGEYYDEDEGEEGTIFEVCTSPYPLTYKIFENWATNEYDD